MPEIPDLECVREILSDRLPGVAIEAVEVSRPIVVRAASEDFATRLTGARFASVGASRESFCCLVCRLGRCLS